MLVHPWRYASPNYLGVTENSIEADCGIGLFLLVVFGSKMKDFLTSDGEWI